MNDELICRLIECCGRLEALNVGPVAKLGLGVESKNLVPLDQGKPVSFLFLVAAGLHHSVEHRVVESESGQQALDMVKPEKEGELVNIRVEPKVVAVCAQPPQTPP